MAVFEKMKVTENKIRFVGQYSAKTKPETLYLPKDFLKEIGYASGDRVNVEISVIKATDEEL